MQFAYNLNGGTAPFVKKFQIGETMATSGVPVIAGGSGQEGCILCSTTAAANCIGITIDTATIVTAQQSDSSDTRRVVSVVINPFAVYRAVISGSATAGTAMSAKTVTTASTDGLTVTTGFDYTNPSVDECSIWGYSGNNAGHRRKITSVGATAATVTVAFPNDTAVGDTFLHAPFCECEDQHVQLTSNFAQVDGSVAVDTDNANFRVVEIDHRDASDATPSAVLLVIHDHLFNNVA